MMRANADVAVYVCVTPVDMRKQATSPALIVEQALKWGIVQPSLYAFSNARRHRIKIVCWRRNGLCLWSKRLEGRDRFLFPREAAADTVRISGAQLEELPAGFDLWRHRHQKLRCGA
jgi:transposase